MMSESLPAVTMTAKHLHALQRYVNMQTAVERLTELTTILNRAGEPESRKIVSAVRRAMVAQMGLVQRSLPLELWNWWSLQQKGQSAEIPRDEE